MRFPAAYLSSREADSSQYAGRGEKALLYEALSGEAGKHGHMLSLSVVTQLMDVGGKRSHARTRPDHIYLGSGQRT
jgi:hypothetical protein